MLQKLRPVVFQIKKKKLLDIFIISNFLFTGFDILYAHSINNFAHWGEWIPLYFCTFAFFALSIGFFLHRSAKGYISAIVGTVSIFIGLWGAIFHLESQFFQSQSLKSLIYTAPFIAPLSFCGLGFLILLNRMVATSTGYWGQWIIFFAYFGFLGNFILSLCDHAQNSFFYWTEWIPIVSSALVLGFIPYYLSPKRNEFIVWLCHRIVILQIFVGLVGAYLHLQAVLTNSADSLIDQILYGAPIMAPLLFTNLAALMLIGMWAYNVPGNTLVYRH